MLHLSRGLSDRQNLTGFSSLMMRRRTMSDYRMFGFYIP